MPMDAYSCSYRLLIRHDMVRALRHHVTLLAPLEKKILASGCRVHRFSTASVKVLESNSRRGCFVQFTRHRVARNAKQANYYLQIHVPVVGLHSSEELVVVPQVHQNLRIGLSCKRKDSEIE